MKYLFILVALLWFGLLGALVFIEIETNQRTEIITFEYNYGGRNTDVAWSMIETNDQGYAIAGTTTSFSSGKYDAFLLKLDSLGGYEWSRRYGGRNTDSATELIQKKDGGYLLTGISDSYDLDKKYDIMLINTEADGTLIWSQSIGGENEDYGTDLLELDDGNIILTGYTYSYGQGADDLFIIKFTPAGDTLWTRLYGEESHEHSYSIDYTNDSGYIISGFTKSFTNGYYDAYVIKTDQEGHVDWSAVYGGDQNDRARMLRKVEDGYLIAGGCESAGAGLMDLMLLKINFDGKLLWSKTYGTPLDETTNYMRLTEDGGCLIVGFSNDQDSPSNRDLIAVKTDGRGDTLWTGLWGTNDLSEFGTSGIEASDGGFTLVGNSGKDNEILLLKLGRHGFKPDQRRAIPIEVNEANFPYRKVMSIESGGLELNPITSSASFEPLIDTVQMKITRD